MEGIRFDGLARQVGALSDRRTTVRALAVSALAVIGASAAWRVEAKKKKKKCKKPKVKCGKKCCAAGVVCSGGQCTAAEGCNFTKTATLWTLQANCTTKTTIEIPAGVTLDGDGKRITLSGPVDGFTAPNPQTPSTGLLANGGTVNVRDLDIVGSGLSGGSCFVGLTYQNASGQVEQVSISNLRPETTVPCASGFRVNGDGAQTVTLLDIEVSNVPAEGVEVNGSGSGVTVDISSADVGGTQVAVGYGGAAAGTISDSVLHDAEIALFAGAGATLTLEDSVLRRTQIEAIQFIGVAAATIRNTTFEDPAGAAPAALIALNGGDLTIENNTVTGYIGGFGFASSPDFGPGGEDPISADVTGNTITGEGAAAPGSAGVGFGRLAAGSVSGNTISNFKDNDAGQTSCGIFIAADAGTVTLGANTFPDPPGNEQDICDNRP